MATLATTRQFLPTATHASEALLAIQQQQFQRFRRLDPPIQLGCQGRAGAPICGRRVELIKGRCTLLRRLKAGRIGIERAAKASHLRKGSRMTGSVRTNGRITTNNQTQSRHMRGRCPLDRGAVLNRILGPSNLGHLADGDLCRHGGG